MLTLRAPASPARGQAGARKNNYTILSSLISGPNIANLSGLSGVIAIGRDLDIRDNAALANLTGLNALTSVGHLAIQENDILANLDRLDHPIGISGSLSIQNNSLLANCAVQAICDYLSNPSG